MKRLIPVLILVLIAAPQAFAGPWLKSVSAAQQKAKGGNRLILVDLFADWCGWCHRMEQEVFPSEAFQKATDDMVLLRVNTEDRGEGSKLAQQFQVTSLPTFVMLTHDMMVAGWIRGYMPAAEFVRAIQSERKKYADFLARSKQESSFANDYARRLQLAREFRERRGLHQSEMRMTKLLAEKNLPVEIRDQAYYELAVTQVYATRAKEALATIEKFAKVQSKGESFERARILAGQIYMQQGNFDAAAREFRNFKTSFPQSQLVKTAEMYLPVAEAQLKKP